MTELEVKALIDKQFPLDKYTTFDACDEIKTWSAKDLKEFLSQLKQEKYNKDIAVFVITKFILYSRGVIEFAELKNNNFIKSL